MWPRGLILRISLILIWVGGVYSADTFCGQLTIHKQKWLSKEAQTLAAQKSDNLRDCLAACCDVESCNAVTFMGFLANSTSDPASNCILFYCGQECVAVDENEAAEGVVSVLIKRNVQAKTTPQAIENSSTTEDSGTTPTVFPITEVIVEDPRVTKGSTVTPDEDDPMQPEKSHDDTVKSVITTTHIPFTNTTTEATTVAVTTRSNNESVPQKDSETTTESPPAASTSFTESIVTKVSLTPVWAVGLAIVLVVVCVGTNMALLSAYFCYRRQRTRTRSAPISSIKAPTLHAFNPPNNHGMPVLHSTMA